jgi:flavin reductase (DIM6/NTAB) family NADH-FMN oxidoreductase RutF
MRDRHPSAELAEKVIAFGNCSGRDVDNFASFGLRTAKAQRVAAALIADCFANVECWAIE